MARSRTTLQDRLQSALASLPTEKLAQVLDFAEYIGAREEWEATQELLTDPGMRADVLEGHAQASRGEGRPWRAL